MSSYTNKFNSQYQTKKFVSTPFNLTNWHCVRGSEPMQSLSFTTKKSMLLQQLEKWLLKSDPWRTEMGSRQADEVSSFWLLEYPSSFQHMLIKQVSFCKQDWCYRHLAAMMGGITQLPDVVIRNETVIIWRELQGLDDLIGECRDIISSIFFNIFLMFSLLLS